MRVAITGASGLIGTALTASLRGDGHDVLRLVRRSARGTDEARWDPYGTLDPAALTGVDAVVNLAGAGIGDRRWTAAYKGELRDSRIRGTTTLAHALAELDRPPAVLVSGSAVGYYGDTGDRAVDETAPPGDDFLAGLCRDWEGATRPAEEAGIRTAHIRSGLVVARDGGVLARMLPLFRLGLGGRLGNGRQYWSLISLRDEVAAIRHVIATEAVTGPVNLACPDPVPNAEAAAALAAELHRPALLPVPGFALRVALGELAGVGVLAGQRVLPRVLLDSGFTFTDPTHTAVLRTAV